MCGRSCLIAPQPARTGITRNGRFTGDTERATDSGSRNPGAFPPRARPLRAAGDRRTARRTVRPAAVPDARDRRDRATGRLGGEGLPPGPGVPDPAARGGEADAPVDACRARHPRLPGDPLAEDAPVDRGDRRRLVGHQLRARGRRGGVLRSPGRGARRGRSKACGPRHLPGRRGRLRRRRGRAARGGGRTQEGAGLQSGRHGLRDHGLLQQRLRPPGLGRRGGRGADTLAGRGPGRRGRSGHRRDGAGDHADRNRGHGGRAVARVARCRRRHRSLLSRRGDPRCPGRHAGPGRPTGPRHRGRGGGALATRQSAEEGCHEAAPPTGPRVQAGRGRRCCRPPGPTTAG